MIRAIICKKKKGNQRGEKEKHFNQLIIQTSRSEGVRVRVVHVNNFKSCLCEMWHLNNAAGAIWHGHSEDVGNLAGKVKEKEEKWTSFWRCESNIFSAISAILPYMPQFFRSSNIKEIPIYINLSLHQNVLG